MILSFFIIAIVVIAMLVIFTIKTRIGLLFLAVLDLICGLIVMGLQGPGSINFLFYEIPAFYSLYLGAALIVKGAYSLVFSFR